MQTKHFDLYELAPPEIINVRGEATWQLFDSRALWTLDALREHYGSIICNTWKNGGRFSLRGLRPADTKTGSKFSQHKFGRAFDLDFKHATPDEVRAHMQANPDAEMYKYIRGIETDISWFHFDLRNLDKVLFFKP